MPKSNCQQNNSNSTPNNSPSNRGYPKYLSKESPTTDSDIHDGSSEITHSILDSTKSISNMKPGSMTYIQAKPPNNRESLNLSELQDDTSTRPSYISRNSSVYLNDNYVQNNQVDEIGFDNQSPQSTMQNIPNHTIRQDDSYKQPHNNSQNNRSHSGIRFRDILIGKIVFIFIDLFGEIFFVLGIILIFILYIINF